MCSGIVVRENINVQQQLRSREADTRHRQRSRASDFCTSCSTGKERSKENSGHTTQAAMHICIGASARQPRDTASTANIDNQLALLSLLKT
jgi:hypothetical protein